MRRKQQNSLDLTVYVSKYLRPLQENKFVVILFFLLSLAMAILINSFVEPEYVSRATLILEEPRTELSRIKDEYVVRRKIDPSYVISETEKLKSTSFAFEVMKILPEDARESLKLKIGPVAQIVEKLKDLIGQENINKIKSLLGKKPKPEHPQDSQRANVGQLMKRIKVENQTESSIIWIFATTFKPEIAPVLIQSYIDVYMATNLEENKRAVRAERVFAEELRAQAFQKFQEAEQELIEFKKFYEIPADIEVGRDIEIQLKQNRLKAELEMAKNRFELMDKIYLETRLREAGITENVRVLEYPAVPLTPSKSAKSKLFFIIILGGLFAGIGAVLVMDHIKGYIRHEKDIESMVDLKILGTVPKLNR